LTRPCTLIVNGKRISVRAGMSLVEAALRGGIVIPTDCASGQCETCRVRVVAGGVASDRQDVGQTVLACQARLSGDAEVCFDDVPAPGRTRGRVSSILALAPDIVEVRVDLDDPLDRLPGQYVKLAFQGYPSRDYSPTEPCPGPAEPSQLVFHIRVYPDGAVSSALNGRIRIGHRVIAEGPFGSAYYRHGQTRLVLVGTGTGWAPLWAIARAARTKEPNRPMRIIVGARRPHGLYMGDALGWLRDTGVSDAVLTCSGAEADEWPAARRGRPTDYLDPITAEDTVYVAGAPAMVEAVKRMAAAAGAQCYADPFNMSSAGQGFLGRLRQALETSDPDRIRPPQDRRARGETGPASAVRSALPSERGRQGLTSGWARWFQSR
jgi:ferredoxin-NAD(P)+ reductase (naphthalene dioxygenase ferredoxin-specific)